MDIERFPQASSITSRPKELLEVISAETVRNYRSGEIVSPVSGKLECLAGRLFFAADGKSARNPVTQRERRAQNSRIPTFIVDTDIVCSHIHEMTKIGHNHQNRPERSIAAGLPDRPNLPEPSRGKPENAASHGRGLAGDLDTETVRAPTSDAKDSWNATDSPPGGSAGSAGVLGMGQTVVGIWG
ncbi:uncharacterized protein CIMG_12756 [Coccidioides immitis RS]|uniref:Uncharacterized protein n=1 Tax=Coccidioides immitis (strain RS) TaxID=246410 RepID=A0A0D8JS16_COCIM|nr:uncharacterized protein CIMG_12756 [Coccidioides immitis RS]KJF60110.1 hypothetical protein CIMG_12756 [Coccidioides immitis RS]